MKRIYKNYIKRLLLIILLSLIVYILYKTFFQKTFQEKQIKQHQEKINKIEIEIEKSEPTLEKMIELAQLYQDGVRGTEVNEDRAIYYYLQATKKGYIDGYYEIARIYHYGLSPNIELAIENYLIYISNSPKCEKKDLAKISLKDIEDEYPEQYKEYMLQSEDIMREHFPLPKQKLKVKESIFEERFEDYDVFNLIPNIREEPRQEVQQIPIIVTNLSTTIRNDAQNVHDHGVQNMIKKALKNLEENSQPQSKLKQLSKEELLKEIGVYIKKHQKDRAYEVFNRMDDTPLSSNNRSEHDALQMVWSRIHEFEDPETRKQLKNQLVNELEDCVENGKIVCKTGRFNRIIDTLTGFDEKIDIKPMWAIKQEIGNKASKVRDDFIKEFPEEQQRVLVSSDGPQNAEEDIIYDKYERELKHRIENFIRKDYEEVLEPELMEREVETWTQNI
jgi:hypothetical protein